MSWPETIAAASSPAAVSAATAMLMMAILAWRSEWLPGRRDVAASLCLGAIYFLYRSNPAALAMALPLIFMGPLVCNRAIRAAFEAPQRPWSVDLVLCVALVSCGTAAYLASGHAVLAVIFNLIALYLFLESPVTILMGMPDDMMEIRRQARIWVLGSSALTSAIICLVSLFAPAPLATLASALLVLGFALAIVAAGPKWSAIAGVSVADLQNTPERRRESDALSAQENTALTRLRKVMDVEKAYRDPALSLSKLAQKMDLPEHRLRRLIHTGAGAQNFSAFLNAYRIGEIRTQLEDPGQADTPILTLALAAGYNSLSVFNRAFKAENGVAPSVYRAKRLDALKASAKPIGVNSEEHSSDISAA